MSLNVRAGACYFCTGRQSELFFSYALASQRILSGYIHLHKPVLIYIRTLIVIGSDLRLGYY